MNVLCIEPTQLYKQLLGHLFDDMGVNTVFVKSGDVALEHLAKMRFDLICVSQTLLCRTGLELVSRILEQELSEAATVLISADTSNEFVVECLNKGVTEVLGKDDFVGIERSLRNIVESKRKQRTGYIAYIEDSPSMVSYVSRLLSSRGYKIDHFETGENAIEAIKQNTYDLVITDVVLKGKLTGMGLLNWVRDRVGTKESLPVLVVSGGNDQSRKVELLLQGANDYLDKPFVADELLARVDNLVTTKHLFEQVKQQQKELYRMATTDQLTGLRNRHSLMDIAEKYVSEALRHSYPMSLLVVDIDHFKHINDSYGHAAGDEVLYTVGQSLYHAFRGEDVVARFGGEEFVILMHRCCVADACRKAESLRKQVQQLCPMGQEITASIGLAEISALRDKSFDGLFQAADEAVYQAKSEGRNRVCVYGKSVRAA